MNSIMGLDASIEDDDECTIEFLFDMFGGGLSIPRLYEMVHQCGGAEGLQHNSGSPSDFLKYWTETLTSAGSLTVSAVKEYLHPVVVEMLQEWGPDDQEVEPSELIGFYETRLGISSQRASCRVDPGPPGVWSNLSSLTAPGKAVASFTVLEPLREFSHNMPAEIEVQQALDALVAKWSKKDKEEKDQEDKQDGNKPEEVPRHET